MATNVGGIPLGEMVLGVEVGTNFSFDIVVAQGLNLQHTRAYNGVFNKTVVSTLNIKDAIVGNKSTGVNDFWDTLDHTIAYTKGKYITQSYSPAQTIYLAANYNKGVLHVFAPYQAIGRTTILNLSVESTLNFTQAVTQHIVQDVYDTLNLTQDIVAYASKSVKNTLEFNQTVAFTMDHNVSVEQNFNLDQTIEMTRSKALKVWSGLAMSQFIKAYRERSETVQHTLNMTHEIRREVFHESVSNTLALGQSLAYTPVYPLSVASTLIFGQSVSNNTTYQRNVSDTLVFLPARSIYIGMGGVANYIIENIQYVKIPAYQVGKKNNPHCVLQVPNGAITLPSPEWADTENYGGIFTIKRSMIGTPYTHVRTLSLRKLKLPWMLAKRKAWELREFLIQHNTELMTLTTWKGDKWFVNLTTNPFELSVKGRYDKENEKVSVELEFEGLKVM